MYKYCLEKINVGLFSNNNIMVCNQACELARIGSPHQLNALILNDVKDKRARSCVLISLSVKFSFRVRVSLRSKRFRLVSVVFDSRSSFFSPKP